MWFVLDDTSAELMCLFVFVCLSVRMLYCQLDAKASLCGLVLLPLIPELCSPDL